MPVGVLKAPAMALHILDAHPAKFCILEQLVLTVRHKPFTSWLLLKLPPRSHGRVFHARAHLGWVGLTVRLKQGMVHARTRECVFRALC